MKEDVEVYKILKDIPYANSNLPRFNQEMFESIKVPAEPYQGILATQGYVSGFDPHSYLMSADASEKRLKGGSTVVGIGVGIQKTSDGSYIITEVFENGPAAVAGLKAGDKITKVAGKDTSTIETVSDLVPLVKGAENTEVTLEIKSSGETKSVTLTRKKVEVSDVRISADSGIADTVYFKYSHFSQNSIQKMKEELQKANAASKKTWILDLKGNPGGLVSEAVELIQMLSGNITQIASLEKKLVFYFFDGANFSGPQFIEAPKMRTAPNLIVLINESSASASEVTSGNLKGLGNALIIGSRSFGKGSMQSGIGVNPKIEAYVTRGIYFTGDNRTPQFLGVEPDFNTSAMRKEIQDIDSSDFQLETDMPGALKPSEGIAPSEALPVSYPKTVACLKDKEAKKAIASKEKLDTLTGTLSGIDSLAAAAAIDCMKETGELK